VASCVPSGDQQRLAQSPLIVRCCLPSPAVQMPMLLRPPVASWAPSGENRTKYATLPASWVSEYTALPALASRAATRAVDRRDRQLLAVGRPADRPHGLPLLREHPGLREVVAHVDATAAAGGHPRTVGREGHAEDVAAVPRALDRPTAGAGNRRRLEHDGTRNAPRTGGSWHGSPGESDILPPHGCMADAIGKSPGAACPTWASIDGSKAPEYRTRPTAARGRRATPGPTGVQVWVSGRRAVAVHFQH
jgi:hypothetical protein